MERVEQYEHSETERAGRKGEVPWGRRTKGIWVDFLAAANTKAQVLDRSN